MSGWGTHASGKKRGDQIGKEVTRKAFLLFKVGRLFANAAALDATRKDGATPLLVAANNGHVAVVEWLLSMRPQMVEVAESRGLLA